MSPPKPTILLIHGALTTAVSFDWVIPHLEQAGYPTVNAEYLSVNPEKPLEVTAQKDIDHVRKTYLDPLIEQEHKDVVLAVHSFGGVIAGGAAVGLSKSDRAAKGLKGGVIGMIFIGANIGHEGQTMLETVGGQWPPWLKIDKPREGLAVIEPLFETLCHDADPSLESEVESQARPHGYLCFATPMPAQSWSEKGYTGRLAYIRTSEDRINPAFAQDMWIQGTGVEWDVLNMEASHAPYISKPKELAQHIVSFAQKFEGL
ncbi:hypothetical protein CKM354_000869600 [Cercospora kikuchii]|uniref:AB hydrolase-1 domain-containing protein n=1 Tax=Cercospora kikuchii TaxID=84275 RepID=A0A9P3CJE6_9PEZI|nr:uncharacterized protein CKM354_000869600 [Cercospora kikuchii]GIZ45534.1 hypothetical protein CKM354_000869600 [Cercospora kikuchii]